jgi:hypothetical protein
MADKKEVSWIESIIDVAGTVIDRIVEHSNEKTKELKKLVLHHVFIYGIFGISVLFILIGLIKYLAEVYFFNSEGIGFLVVGSMLMVMLSAYSLIHNNS